MVRISVFIKADLLDVIDAFVRGYQGNDSLEKPGAALRPCVNGETSRWKVIIWGLYDAEKLEVGLVYSNHKPTDVCRHAALGGRPDARFHRRDRDDGNVQPLRR